MRLLVIIAIAGVLVYVVLCAVMFIFQRSFIYHPQPRRVASEAEIMSLATDEGDVLVSVKPQEGSEAVIYFGGNAEDVSWNMPDLARAFPDRAIFLMHYRGYGGSAGRPTESALFADAEALFDRVRQTHDDVTVIGRSLGSGVAVYLASTRPVSRLVLVTPFDSLEEIAAEQFPFLPVRWLLTDKYQSNRYAPRVNAPTQIIAAENDTLIPAESSQKLHTRFAPGVAMYHVVPNADHNNISFASQYLPLLRGS